jgi:hypothetical protein
MRAQFLPFHIPENNATLAAVVETLQFGWSSTGRKAKCRCGSGDIKGVGTQLIYAGLTRSLLPGRARHHDDNWRLLPSAHVSGMANGSGTQLLSRN